MLLLLGSSVSPGTFLDSELVGFLDDSDNVLVVTFLGTNEGASTHEDADVEDEVEVGDHGVAAGFNVGWGVGTTAC